MVICVDRHGVNAKASCHAQLPIEKQVHETGSHLSQPLSIMGGYNLHATHSREGEGKTRVALAVRPVQESGQAQSCSEEPISLNIRQVVVWDAPLQARRDPPRTNKMRYVHLHPHAV